MDRELSIMTHGKFYICWAVSFTTEWRYATIISQYMLDIIMKEKLLICIAYLGIYDTIKPSNIIIQGTIYENIIKKAHELGLIQEN